jgi:hypothetical protein
VTNVAVTDEHVATIRALLHGNIQGYLQMIDDLERANRLDGYEALLGAAALEAFDRRFGRNYTTADIVTYVADARTRFSETGADFDPRAAEQLIHAALGDASIDGLTDQTIAQLQVLLLGDLITAKRLDDAELDEFVGEARALAEESLALEWSSQERGD